MVCHKLARTVTIQLLLIQEVHSSRCPLHSSRDFKHNGRKQSQISIAPVMQTSAKPKSRGAKTLKQNCNQSASSLVVENHQPEVKQSLRLTPRSTSFNHPKSVNSRLPRTNWTSLTTKTSYSVNFSCVTSTQFTTMRMNRFH